MHILTKFPWATKTFDTESTAMPLIDVKLAAVPSPFVVELLPDPAKVETTAASETRILKREY